MFGQARRALRPCVAGDDHPGRCWLAVSMINGWSSRVTPARCLAGAGVPDVAVLIPTLGEPVPMVLRTVLSVIDQDYPSEHMLVLVSDDAGNPALAAELDGLGVVVYHRPRPRSAPGRDGAAKAGNLNSRDPDLGRLLGRDELGRPRRLRGPRVVRHVADPGPSHPRPPAPHPTRAPAGRLIARRSRRPSDPRRGRVTRRATSRLAAVVSRRRPGRRAPPCPGTAPRRRRRPHTSRRPFRPRRRLTRRAVRHAARRRSADGGPAPAVTPRHQLTSTTSTGAASPFSPTDRDSDTA